MTVGSAVLEATEVGYHNIMNENPESSHLLGNETLSRFSKIENNATLTTKFLFYNYFS